MFHFRDAEMIHLGVLVDAGYKVAEIIHLGLLVDAGYKKKYPISFRVADCIPVFRSTPEFRSAQVFRPRAGSKTTSQHLEAHLY